MKPVAFDYARPSSLREACALLASDPDARVLAGGQTLIPMLAMRLARPSRLIDIARIPELSGIRDDGTHLSIGAATRQAAAERDPVIARKLPLLAKVLPWVGHAPTRARGTVGGSIAHGDPAAEIPLVAVTLGATLVAQTAGGTLELPADKFYLGPMMTALPEGAILASVRFPVWASGSIGTGFHEVSSRRSDFALVSAAAQVALDAAGRCTALAASVGGASDSPVRLAGLEALVGSRLEEEAVRTAVAASLAGLDIMRDHHASADYRKRVAVALARRAILDARNEAAAGARHAR